MWNRRSSAWSSACLFSTDCICKARAQFEFALFLLDCSGILITRSWEITLSVCMWLCQDIISQTSIRESTSFSSARGRHSSSHMHIHTNSVFHSLDWDISLHHADMCPHLKTIIRTWRKPIQMQTQRENTASSIQYSLINKGSWSSWVCHPNFTPKYIYLPGQCAGLLNLSHMWDSHSG